MINRSVSATISSLFSGRKINEEKLNDIAGSSCKIPDNLV